MGKTVLITGTLHDFAAAVGSAIGRPVKYVAVPIEAAVAGMRGMGMDDWMVAIARNWAADVTGDFAAVVGRPARSVADFARDFAGAFKG